MNRVVAQQELERQNFRVRGSGGDAVFRPAARWLRPPFPACPFSRHVQPQQPSVTISLSAWGPAHACEEPLRFFDLRNFGPRVEADEGGNEQFAGDLIPTGRLTELCK
jgi:hypothetical protein